MRIPAPQLLLLVVAALALGGCSSTREQDLHVRGVSPMNVNVDKESTPVTVRAYALINDDKFRKATVDQLWTDAEKVLAGDMLGQVSTFTVFPGAVTDEPVEHTLTIDKTARYIGLLAMYQNADAQDRRTLVVSVDDVGDEIITFSGFAVAIETARAAGN